MNLSVHNHFDIELRDAKTGEVKQRCTAYNMVLDNLYNKWCNISTVWNNSVSYIWLTSNVTPMAITDTTAPSPRWSNYVTLANGTYDGTTFTLTKTGTTTFSESQANADLTAVMVGSNADNMFTYAQFTDTEGHPIIITKTNSDTLTITVTMYVTFIYDYQSSPLQMLPTNYRADPCYPQDNGDLSKHCPAYLSRVGVGSTDARGMCLSTLSKYVCTDNTDYLDPNYFAPVSISRTNTRCTTSRILSTELNSKITYQVRGIALFCMTINSGSSTYRPTEFISLPNHAIYPPKQLTLTTSGDGNTVDFNLGVPLLMTDNVQVYINDVLQSTDTYTFNGKDYNFYQAWESGDSQFVTKLENLNTWYYGTTKYTHLCNFPQLTTSGQGTWYKQCYYDFKSPITVTHLKGMSEYTTKSDKVWYSTDNTNWTQITEWTATTTDLTLSTPIQARYWRITDMNAGGLATTHYGKGYVSTAFGDPKPQLHFNTAPSDGSTITVKAYTEYPIKNSNWIIEPMTIDFNIQRGN